MNPFIQSKIVLFLSLNRSEPFWASLNRSKPFKTDKHDTRNKTTHAANMTRMKSATRAADLTHVSGDMTSMTETACVAKTTCASGPSRVSNVASTTDTTCVLHSTSAPNVECVAEMTRVLELARVQHLECVPAPTHMSYPPRVLHLAHVSAQPRMLCFSCVSHLSHVSWLSRGSYLFIWIWLKGPAGRFSLLSRRATAAGLSGEAFPAFTA